ncbi:hypothetical protein D3C85_1649920 [compost metagenome]
MPVTDQQRVDQEGTLAIADLDQPGFRVEGVNPHEFGVDGDKGQLMPVAAVFGQALVVTDPVYFDGHEALPLTLARSIYGAGTAGETRAILDIDQRCCCVCVRGNKSLAQNPQA